MSDGGHCIYIYLYIAGKVETELVPYGAESPSFFSTYPVCAPQDKCAIRGRGDEVMLTGIKTVSTLLISFFIFTLQTQETLRENYNEMKRQKLQIHISQATVHKKKPKHNGSVEVL